MKQDKKNAPPKVKTIHWKNPPVKNKENEGLEELFPGKDIDYSNGASNSTPKGQNGDSSQLLKRFPDCPQNPFADFSRHGTEPSSTSSEYQKRELKVILTGLLCQDPEVIDKSFKREKSRK